MSSRKKQLELPYQPTVVELPYREKEEALPTSSLASPSEEAETPFENIVQIARVQYNRILTINSAVDPGPEDIRDCRFLLEKDINFRQAFSDCVQSKIPVDIQSTLFLAAVEACNRAAADREVNDLGALTDALRYLLDEARQCPPRSILVLHPDTNRAFGYIDLQEDLYTPAPLPRDLNPGSATPQLVWVQPPGLRVLPQVEVQFTQYLFDSGRDLRIVQQLRAKAEATTRRPSPRFVDQAVALATVSGRKHITAAIDGSKFPALLGKHVNYATQQVTDSALHVVDAHAAASLPSFVSENMQSVCEDTITVRRTVSVIDPLAWNLNSAKDPERDVTIALCQKLSRVLEKHAAPGVSLIVKTGDVSVQSADLFDTWHVQAQMPVQIFKVKLLETVADDIAP